MNSPLGRLSPAEARFEDWRSRIGLIAGPILFGLILLIPIPTLPVPAHRTLAVLALMATWWMTEALPLAATALLGPALAVLLGVAPAREVLRPFADPVIFLFLGGFLIAEAMVKHGLNRRIALTVLAIPGVGGSGPGLLAGFGFLTAFISAWVSNTATAAMMLPIAISILRETAARPGGPHGADRDWRTSGLAVPLILTTAFAASIGGLATPIGTPPNLIGIGLIERTLQRRLTFFEWMQVGLPAALILTVWLVWRMSRIPRGIRGGLAGGGEWVRGESARLGPWSRAQLQVALVFALAVGFWVLPGLAAVTLGPGSAAEWLNRHLPESTVAVLAAVVLFALPAGDTSGQRTLTWADAARIDWGTILLFGGGMALGELMFATGLAEWLEKGVAAALPIQTVFSLTLLFAAIAVVVSETTSNTASATMIIPLAVAVAQGAGVDPLKPALAACLGSSLGFMLPVSTPPNALAYGTGAVPLTRMIRHGMGLDVVSCIVVVACVMFLAR